MMSINEELRLAAHIVNYAISLPLMILGMIGVILSISIFTLQPSFRRNTTIKYLLAGTILAGIHFFLIDIQTLLVGGFDVGVYNTNISACREHTYLRYVTTVSAICFPCWAAFDQYAATSHEANFRTRWRSSRFVRLAIISTIIFWTLMYIPIIPFSDIIDGSCKLRPSPYTTFNTYALTPLVHSVIPAMVMIYYTRGTIHNLRSSNIQHSHGQLAKQVRRMVMPQLFFLAVSGVPFSLEGIYYYATRDLQRDVNRHAWENLISQFIMLFYHMNFTFTFYLYAFMSSEVRKVLRQQVFRCIGRQVSITKDPHIGNSVLLETRHTMTVPLAH